MVMTPITDLPAVPLQPTGFASGTQYNPSFVAADPLNGNYFTATGRDLMTFYCSSVALAPAWSNTVNYTFGMVVNGGGSPSSAYIAVASSGPTTSVQQPPNAAYWAVYNGLSTISVISAPDACTGRTANFTNYIVPNGGFTEFLVLPSSVFTQADGQVQFLASSSLIQVLVRSL